MLFNKSHRHLVPRRCSDMAEAHCLQAARVVGVDGHAHHGLARAGQRGAQHLRLLRLLRGRPWNTVRMAVVAVAS